MSTEEFKQKVLRLLDKELKYHTNEAQKDRVIPCIDEAVKEEAIVKELNYIITYVKAYRTDN